MDRNRNPILASIVFVLVFGVVALGVLGAVAFGIESLGLQGTRKTWASGIAVAVLAIAVVATYQLSDFVRHDVEEELPGRGADLFQAQERLECTRCSSYLDGDQRGEPFPPLA